MAAQKQYPHEDEEALVMDRLAYLEPMDSKEDRKFRSWYILDHLEDWDWDKIDHYNNLLHRYLHGERRYQGVLIHYHGNGDNVA